MLVQLRDELFAFAAFFDVVLHPSTNFRFRRKESTGEPSQQFADQRGAALDFYFCLVEHAAIYFPIKVEQVAHLESKDAHLKVEALSVKLRNKTAFIDNETAEGLVNADNRPWLNEPRIICNFFFHLTLMWSWGCQSL